MLRTFRMKLPNGSQHVTFGELISKIRNYAMIQVFIPNYKCVELAGSNNRSYNAYTVQVNSGNRIYTVERRYSDFLQLHKKIRKQYATPEFPPKRVRNNRSIVLESRRLALQTYLQIMIQLNPMPKELMNFLNLQQNPHRQNGIFTAYDDHSNSNHSNHSSVVSGENGFDIDQDDYQKVWSMHASLNPAAAFVDDPFLIESDSSSSNLSDCVTRSVLDAIYRSDI